MAKINNNCMETHQLAGSNTLSIKVPSTSNANLWVVLLLGLALVQSSVTPGFVRCEKNKIKY